MRIITFTLIQITGLLVLSCGKENDKATQQVVASPQGAVTPPIGQNPQPAPDQKDFPYSSRVYATSADLPACTESLKGALAYLMVQKIFQSCDANAWVTVVIDNKSSSSSVGLEVVDAENNKVANLLGPYIKNTNAFYDLHLLDGVTIPIDGNKIGKNFFEDGSLPIDVCQYTSNNCSGTCYAGASVYTDVVTDMSGQFRQKIKEASAFRTILSYASNPTGFKHSITCLDIGGGGTSVNSVATKPYTPAQFKYPFAMPLSVR